MGENSEKLKHLLPHLLEHNLDHIKEHRKWVKMCEDEGLKDIAEELRKVVEYFEACTPCFEAAVEKIEKV